MLPTRPVVWGTFLPLLLVGCSLSPVYLVNRPAMARCLPDGISMNDFVEQDWTGLKVTVGMKLARLGAYPGSDGKLYDLSGRRIEFFRHYDGGVDPGMEFIQQASQRLEELKKTATVIEIRRDPDWPLPV